MKFDRVFLDYFWMPDSVVWLNRSYMVSFPMRSTVQGSAGDEVLDILQILRIPPNFLISTTSAMSNASKKKHGRDGCNFEGVGFFRLRQ